MRRDRCWPSTSGGRSIRIVDEWKRPPPQLTRKPRKFPFRFIVIIILLILVLALLLWFFLARWFPVDLLLFLWAFGAAGILFFSFFVWLVIR